MSQTKTIQTEYGDVEVATVDCDSCGQTIHKENAVEFTIGERSGYACEHCEETGPIDFPERVREFTLPKEERPNSRKNGLGFHLAIAFLVVPFIFFHALTSDYQFSNGYAIGALVVFVWLVLPLLGYILLV